MSVTPSLYSANIIFDIGGVLVRPNKAAIVAKMGYMNLTKYTSTFHNPLQLQNQWFKLLSTIKAPDIGKNKEGATYRGTMLPDIMCAWLRNDTSAYQILRYVYEAIESQCKWQFEKEIFHAIAATNFEPVSHVSMHEWIPEALQIVQDCYDEKEGNQRKHRLFILSNYNSEALWHFYDRNKKVFKPFDGMVISGDVGLIKPDPAIYKLLLEQYDLDPQESYFIDDQQENLKAAKSLGINTVHCDDYDYKKVRRNLVFSGILKK